jgi:signal peptidase
VIKAASRLVLLLSFFAACMVYGIGFMAVLLDARPLVVTGASMMPAVNQGDALVVRKAAAEMIQVGDIITFQNFGRLNPTTHRVTSIRDVAGEIWYQTKGDHNDAPDQDLTPYGAVLGKVRLVLPKMGYLLGFVATPSGVLTLISLPLLVMLVQEFLLLSARRRPNQ